MALTKLEFTRQPFEEGRIFGETGAYEQLKGKAHFVDVGIFLAGEGQSESDLGLPGRIYLIQAMLGNSPTGILQGPAVTVIDLVTRIGINTIDIEPINTTF